MKLALRVAGVKLALRVAGAAVKNITVKTSCHVRKEKWLPFAVLSV